MFQFSQHTKKYQPLRMGELLFVFLFSAISILSFYPPLQFFLNTNLLISFLVCLLFLHCCLSNCKYFLYVTPWGVITSLIFLYMAAVALITESFSLLNRIIFFATGVMLFPIYKYYDRIYNIKRLLVVSSFIVSPFIFLTIYNSLEALELSSFSMRGTRPQAAGYEELLRNEVGGYAFVYGAVFLSFIMLAIAFQKKISLLRKLVFYLFFASLFYLVFKSNFTMALLIQIAGSGLLLIHAIFDRIKLKKMSWVAFFFFVLSLPLLLTYIASHYNFQSLDRLRIISSYLFNGNSNFGFFDARINVLLQSLDLMISNFLIGAISIFPGDQVFLKIGRHSEFIDIAVIFGVFPGIIFLSCLAYPIIRMRFIKGDMSTHMLKILVFVFCMAFLILGFFNVITFSVFLVIYVLLPGVLSRNPT